MRLASLDYSTSQGQVSGSRRDLGSRIYAYCIMNELLSSFFSYMFQVVLDPLQLLEQEVHVDHIGQDEQTSHGGQKIARGTDLENKEYVSE